MGKPSWLVTSAVSQFADLAMNTRGAKATNAVLNVTLAISVTKVSPIFINHELITLVLIESTN